MPGMARWAFPSTLPKVSKFILEKTEPIEYPFEQAFFVLVHFPYLEPVENVKNRVSPLAGNIPLHRHNRAPLSIMDVPDVLYVKGILGIYGLNRFDLLQDVFIRA